MVSGRGSGRARAAPSRWLILLLLGVVLVGLHFEASGLLVDDAFIVFRYVQNWVAGEGLVFNPGERVEGYSCPTWVFLLAPVEWLGLPTPAVARWLGLAFGVVAAGLVAAAIGSGLGLSFRYRVLGALVVVTSWPIVFWAGAGLETALFGTLLAGLVLLGSRNEPLLGARGVGSALAAAAVTATRPEGVMFALAFMSVLAWTHLRSSGRWKELVAPVGLFLLVVGLGVVVRLGYYDELLPNTFHAKVGGEGLPLRRGFEYLGGYLLRGSGLPLAVLAFLGTLGLLDRKGSAGSEVSRTMLWVAAAMVGCGVVFILAVGGDGLYSYRFVAHVVPAISVLAVAAAARLDRFRARLGAALLTVALVAGAVPVWTTDLLPGFSNNHVVLSEDRWSDIGRSLANWLPPGGLLGTNVAGKVPYHSGMETLDLLGLTDREIARAEAPEMGTGYAGHERSDPAVLMERRPDVLFFSVLDPLPPQELARWRQIETRLSTTALAGYAPLFASPEFRGTYVPGGLLLESRDIATLYFRREFAQGFSGRSGLIAFDWTD